MKFYEAILGIFVDIFSLFVFIYFSLYQFQTMSAVKLNLSSKRYWLHRLVCIRLILMLKNRMRILFQQWWISVFRLCNFYFSHWLGGKLLKHFSFSIPFTYNNIPLREKKLNEIWWMPKLRRSFPFASVQI